MSDVAPKPDADNRSLSDQILEVKNHIGAWALANAIHLNNQAQASHLEKMLGKAITTVPFGNVIQVQLPSRPELLPCPVPSVPVAHTMPVESVLSKAAKVGALLLGAGAAGAGGVALVNSFRQPAAPAVAPAGPDKAEWILEVKPEAKADGK